MSAFNSRQYYLGMGNTQYTQIATEAVRRAKQRNQMQIGRTTSLANQIGLTQEKMLAISSLNVGQMVQQLNQGSLTSLSIVLSLAIRTSTIGKKLNLYTQTNFDYALQAAQKCDQIRKQTAKKNWTFRDQPLKPDTHLPPLFGIPISIKDTYNVSGLMTTIGLANRTNFNQVRQSALVTCFKNSGMIPFVKSNVPQFGMATQSINQIWGRSLNPWNTDRATGGSSGGQAGLIASKCSVLGLGSDIGGSIRIPSQFCGVFGFKPFSKRISSSYHAKLSDAFSGLAMAIPLCIGPLARSAQDIAYFLKIATSQQLYGKNFDVYHKNIEFDQKLYLNYCGIRNKLRIGFFTSLKDIQPTQASIRAVDQTITLLSKLGHECIKIEVPKQQQIIRQFLRENLGTKGETYRQILAGEEPIQQYASLFQIAEMSAPIKGIAKCASRHMMPRINYYFVENSNPMSGYNYQTHLGVMDQYRQEWIEYWRNNNLDFVIAPGFGCQALLHGKSEKTALAVSYTFIWNVLDMAVGSMPVTVVRENQQIYQTTHNDMLADELREIAKGSAGLPVGVQVIGLPYEEEKVLGLMSLLERQIQFYSKHPLPNLQ